jgi:glutamate carboxypeptidase
MAEQPDSDLTARILQAAARRKEKALVSLTRRLVLAESPSESKQAVDACVDLAAAEAAALGARVKRHRNKDWGDLLEARFGPRPKKGAPPPILLLGHLDTVWPTGTLKTMPCRIGDGRLWGPGAMDMKAGVAMAFIALELLAEANLLHREVVLLLTGDEEVGSPASRPVTERLAAASRAVFVLEPALGRAYKTARKGNGVWRVEVQGVAAHSGVDFGAGASAILELARVVRTVSGWTDPERGVTVNPGRIGGGTKPNVVAAEAWADVDVRIARRADGRRMERLFSALRPGDRRCSLTVSGGLKRPPMERTRATARLFARARALATELGFELEEACSGGASDGNFTAALGIPTLDGMGPVGEGMHAAHESVFLEHLAPRTALLAAMIAAG